MIDPGLGGRTMLITGASNPEGIGAALARAFAAQGARVVLTYLRLQPEDDAGEPGTPSMEHQARLNARTAAGVVAEIREPVAAPRPARRTCRARERWRSSSAGRRRASGR